MEKEFVHYELALKLKELGFKEDCFRYYNVHGELGNSFNLSTTVAPLWQQAFDFMAFKCSIHGNVITSGRNEIYITSEYRQDYGGTKSNGGTYTDIYQCRIDLLEDMIELFKRPRDY